MTLATTTPTASAVPKANGSGVLDPDWLGGAFQEVSEKGAADGYCDLDSGGKIPTARLPGLALTDVYTVGSQAAQLALSAEEGDIAIRTDENKSYAHNGGSSGTMSDWSLLLTPTDAVLTVFGRTGAVTAQAGDYTAVQIDRDPTGLLSDDNVQDAIDVLAERVDERQPLHAALTRLSSIESLTDAATVTIAAAANKGGILTSLSQATNFANPSTDCGDMQFYEMRITSGTSRALTYGTKFVGTDDMPISLVANTSGGGKTDSILWQRHAAADKYVLCAKNLGRA